jgi:hypothetical protein
MTLRSPSYLVAAFIGIAVAMFLMPVTSVMRESVLDAYDQQFPVATVKGLRVPGPEGEVRLTMLTTKHRDCELLRVFSFDKAEDGTHVRAKIEKLETGELETIPAGHSVQSTVWRVYPVTGKSIVVFAEHSCDDRIVRTRLIEMEI